jgi:hypothetical protein
MSSRIQSILFDKRYFTYIEAIEWLLIHNKKMGKLDETKRYYRFRKLKPNKNKKYRTKTITKGIKFIFEI